MNNLKNMRTYLAGAMDRVPDGGIGWRNAITPMLQELSVSVINPCDKPIESAKETPTTREIINYYKQTGQFNKIREEYGHIRNANRGKCSHQIGYFLCYLTNIYLVLWTLF